MDREDLVISTRSYTFNYLVHLKRFKITFFLITIYDNKKLLIKKHNEKNFSY